MKTYILIIIISSIYISGCSWVVDLPRSILGSSIRVLSDKRTEAQTKTFDCDLSSCFEAVLEMTLPYGAEDLEDEKFVVFAKDARQRYMILMDVPGSVDTTEVGVFFDTLDDGRVKVDISSLSTRAKNKVAELVFDHLSGRFTTDL